ncbi:calmodulin-like protein 5 [Nannospalax galili]|uniref:calmodulin-like protein 5 n=1 Tax=Nannospalax galili TaxID=1026970 RepID=UPI0004ED1025|nr:calmodulin-like protein 5 [Nannospalax galili]XP_029421112.1 calmodulin-like protein 5 [Nannospalax galili]XP_029421113.1 calmodulin-like protein 5 [Nannospalax galili]XP_029421114.1 calmodulin-like protein 5 [Nannospalax galili]
MAHGFTKEQVDEFHTAFSRFDKNGDGHINVQELGDVMKQLNKNLSEEELKELISRVDTDGDGTISFDEFLAAMAKYASGGIAEKELRAVFSVFDQNGDGHISVDELKQAMTQLGEKLSQEELDAMIREADVDKDGKVNYEEFVRILSEK